MATRVVVNLHCHKLLHYIVLLHGHPDKLASPSTIVLYSSTTWLTGWWLAYIKLTSSNIANSYCTSYEVLLHGHHGGVQTYIATSFCTTLFYFTLSPGWWLTLPPTIAYIVLLHGHPGGGKITLPPAIPLHSSTTCSPGWW